MSARDFGRWLLMGLLILPMAIWDLLLLIWDWLTFPTRAMRHGEEMDR